VLTANSVEPLPSAPISTQPICQGTTSENNKECGEETKAADRNISILKDYALKLKYLMVCGLVSSSKRECIFQ